MSMRGFRDTWRSLDDQVVATVLFETFDVAAVQLLAQRRELQQAGDVAVDLDLSLRHRARQVDLALPVRVANVGRHRHRGGWRRSPGLPTGDHLVRHVDYHDGLGIAEIEGDNQSGVDEFRTDLRVVERAFEDAADVLGDLFRVVEPHRSLPHLTIPENLFLIKKY